MSEQPPIDELELTDAELMQVLKNHGIDRRLLMKVAGAGIGIAALGGTATAGGGGRGNRIHRVYGAPYAAGVDTVPSGLVDHDVALQILIGEAGEHEGFPIEEVVDEENGLGEEPPEAIFDPIGLHVRPGEVVNFTVHGFGLHTVTSFHPKYSEPPFFELPHRVPTDHAFTAPPVAEGDSWLYRFTTKGVYDILCLPHLTLGMVMRIVVFDPADDDITDDRFDDWGPLEIPNAGAVLADDALDPANIVDQGTIGWSDLDLP